MARLVQWEQQIGRRLRLRDLFVFFTVVEYGSMAKAALLSTCVLRPPKISV